MKKIMILVLIVAALLVTIIPNEFVDSCFEKQELIEECGIFGAHILIFWGCVTVPLFWVGIPAGWRLAKNNFWGFGAGAICALIGLWLSLPIAIVQVIRSSDRN